MVVERLVLHGVLDLQLPDGSVVRVQPGPYRKGISVVPLSLGRRSDVVASGGTRGRRPRASTVKLRAILARDAQADKVRAAKEYVKWLVQHDDDISLSVARQVVYRERKAVLEA